MLFWTICLVDSCPHVSHLLRTMRVECKHYRDLLAFCYDMFFFSCILRLARKLQNKESFEMSANRFDGL